MIPVCRTHDFGAVNGTETLTGVAAVVAIAAFASVNGNPDYTLTLEDGTGGDELFFLSAGFGGNRSVDIPFKKPIDVPNGTLSITKGGGLGGWTNVFVAYIPREQSVDIART